MERIYGGANAILTEMEESIRYEALGPDNFDLIGNLFGKRGASGGCWCMYWRLRRRDYEKNKGRKNQMKFKDLALTEARLGVLAILDKEAIGWCSISPRKSLSRLEQSRYFKPIDNKECWSVTCFFVKKEYRKKGISSQLLNESVHYAQNLGARCIEAYPITSRPANYPDLFAYVGFKSTFLKSGFKTAKVCSPNRSVMRLETA